MKREKRLEKWRKYRQELDSVESLDFSIVNSDEELKKIFTSIDFDIEKAYIRSGYKTNLFIDEHYKSSKIIHRQEINEIINRIEKNENLNSFNNLDNIDFNSHKNDQIINEDFKEFLDDEQMKQNNEIETTDLKIKRVKV